MCIFFDRIKNDLHKNKTLINETAKLNSVTAFLKSVQAKSTVTRGENQYKNNKENPATINSRF